MIAADDLREAYPGRKIFVVDTLSASLGQGLLVYLCVQEKRKGKTIDQVHVFAEETKAKVCHWFTVDDLLYLHRGGRVPKSAAVMGSLLSVKPILYVSDEGKLLVWKKARGRKRALEMLAKQMNKHIREIGTYPVTISHGDCQEDAEYLKEYILSHTAVEQVEIHMLDTVIGAHAGPGTVALFCYGDKRGE